MPLCRTFAFGQNSVLNALQRATVTIIPSTFEVLASTLMSGVEGNILIMLSARIIASLGFGLVSETVLPSNLHRLSFQSILVIWLRWFTPAHFPLATFWLKSKEHRNRWRHPIPTESDIFATARRTRPQVRNTSQANTPLRRSGRDCSRRVNFADKSHLKPIRATQDNSRPAALQQLRLSSLPDDDIFGPRATVSAPSTPTQSVILPSTPTLKPTLTLEDAKELEGPHRRSSSTSRLIFKVKAPFQPRNKRLLPFPRSEAPGRLLGF
jgi:hypothetical protein